MNLKQKLRHFFKTKDSSDHAVELLKNFIMPFSRGMKKMTVDDVMNLFFNVENRGFFYAKANRDFSMPGKYYIAGNRPVYGTGPRAIKQGKAMMIIVDKVDQTAKIEVVSGLKEHNYLLEKFEFETIKDWVDVIP